MSAHSDRSDAQRALDHPKVETLRLRATLADLLRLVTELRDIPAMGRRGRLILLALKQAAHDVPLMGGVVAGGEVHAAIVRREYAVCHCGDGQHEFRKDWPRGRGSWSTSRHDTEGRLRRVLAQHATWDPKQPEPHLVTHLIATTATEVEQ